MLTDRAIYETLSRKDLQDLVAHFEITVADRRVRDNLCRALVAARKVRLADAVARLPLASLKEVCQAHDLDDAGRQKAVLAERIIKAVKPAKAAKPAKILAKTAKAEKSAKAVAKATKPAKPAKAAAKPAKAEKPAKAVAKATKPAKPARAAAKKADQTTKVAAKAPKAAKAAPKKADKAVAKEIEAPKTNLLAHASAMDAARVVTEVAAITPKKAITLVSVPDGAPTAPAAVQAPAGAPPLNPTRTLDWPENLPTPPMQRSEVAAPVFQPRAVTEKCVACAHDIELRKCQVQRCNNHIMASPTYKICAECLFERNTLSMTDFNERLQEEGTCPHCGHAWKKAS